MIFNEQMASQLATLKIKNFVIVPKSYDTLMKMSPAMTQAMVLQNQRLIQHSEGKIRHPFLLEKAYS